jgi:hypothetical protein
MHEHNDASVSTPGDRRGVWGHRLSAGAALLLVGLLSFVGSASAAPAAPIGQWTTDNAWVDLGGGESWRLGYAGGAVEVVCTEGSDGTDQTKVRGYFGQGEEVDTGWTAAGNVRVQGWTPSRCGLFDW